MKNLKELTDDQILDSLKRLVEAERSLTGDAREKREAFYRHFGGQRDGGSKKERAIAGNVKCAQK